MKIVFNAGTMENGSEQDFLRLFSHQLKSPLNSIQSLLNTIVEGLAGEVNTKTLKAVERAIEKSRDAREVISDLIDFELYSQENGRQQELNLTELLHDLALSFSHSASEKGITFNFDLPGTEVIVWADPRRLKQAVGNILDNAVRFTPSNGKVEVKLSPDRKAKSVTIKVTDTGPGIAPEERDRVFEPFYRSPRLKATVPGTGLGLSISKKVIDNHGWEIHFTSGENRGTSFEITLPYVKLEDRKYERERKKVVIIGGVTAGPKVAARLRRLDENVDIILVERGRFLSYSGCGLPSYISGKVRSPRELMTTSDSAVKSPEFFESISHITTLNNTMALEIERDKKRVLVKDLMIGPTSYIPYDYLVLATGTVPDVPDIPGVNQSGIFTLHTLEDAEGIKKTFSDKNARDVCIIGGGLIGISAAEALIETGARVTILEKKPHILLKLLDPDIAEKIQNELNKKGIKVVTEVEIKEIKKLKDQFVILTQNSPYTADLVILSTGVKPNAALARSAGLEIGESGGVKVDSFLKSSDRSIYAVGDCAESINLITGKHEYWPLGSISTKMGRIVADNIFGISSKFEGSIGTTLFRIIDINVGRTGLTGRVALLNGFEEVETVTVSGLDRAHYSGDAKHIILKVIADRRTRRLLGAQGYGKGDIIPRIEILACAIMQSLTLDQVFKLDLGYAPAFNNPVDIAQTACNVLENKINGLVKTINIQEFDKIKEEVNILDVSPLSEHSAGSIPNSINLPLENLRRENLPFDRDSKIVLYSKTSSSAYIAYRYLSAKGYSDLMILEGGYIYWER